MSNDSNQISGLASFQLPAELPLGHPGHYKTFVLRRGPNPPRQSALTPNFLRLWAPLFVFSLWQENYSQDSALTGDTGLHSLPSWFEMSCPIIG